MQLGTAEPVLTSSSRITLTPIPRCGKTSAWTRREKVCARFPLLWGWPSSTPGGNQPFSSGGTDRSSTSPSWLPLRRSRIRVRTDYEIMSDRHSITYSYSSCGAVSTSSVAPGSRWAGRGCASWRIARIGANLLAATVVVCELTGTPRNHLLNSTTQKSKPNALVRDHSLRPIPSARETLIPTTNP